MNKYKVGLQLLFNSNEFIFIFLPITLLVYFILARYKLIKLATLSLVVASLAFYWVSHFLLLPRRRTWLTRIVEKLRSISY
ncbi:MAG: hypothetical protein H6Q69_1267 [Firmicutes bacterium]|nr:hypothetical protein [Bacillota bacterium]